MVKKFVKGGMMSKGKWVEENIETIGGDKGNAGHLAIGTGIGKTTKLINCLVKGAKGEVEMAYCLRGKPTERASEEEIKEGKHDPEMKSLYKSHGGYPQKVKEKQIPKDDTIIVFDEAHFNDAGYQALQFEMIKAGYKCLRMSATFAGAEFSTTSSYPMKRVFSGKLDPNMPAGLMIYQNAEQVEKLETLRGVPTGNNVSYMVYTPEFDENCEDISHGRSKGSADNVDGSKEMGYTPGIDTVISLGATETTNLGKYFTYSEPNLNFTQISSLVQQMGRVSRIKYGLAITLTKECGEIDLSDNVSAAMVKATFNGDTKQIKEKKYEQIYDIDILRGALAYPDPKTFGKAPEEILMGLKITKDQQSKKEKLTQLV
nr:11301_t:CDS:2 [Entrophospora candida]